MLKISMFETREERARHFNNLADAIERNGLREAREELREAEEGISRKTFFEWNKGIPEDKQDAAWEHQLEWLRGRIEYLEKKIRKYRKEALK